MFKIVAAVILSLYFLFQLFLLILQYRNRHAPIPEELSDVYDQETYLKWKQYSAEKVRIAIISKTVEFAILMGLLMSNLFALVSKSIVNEYISMIVVLAIYIGATTLVGVVFDYINSIKIEGKYGFNKSSMKTFVVDQIKGLIISSILIIGLTSAFIAIYNALHDYILIVFSGLLFVFVLFIFFLYPYLSKLFNKFTPLEEGELRATLTDMLIKHGYQISDIKVMDASRRTTKSNAYIAGLGKSKTIVLYDNMIEAMSPKQIVAVFAHEMGHGLHKDSAKNTCRSLGTIIIYVTLAWLLVKFPQIYLDFGFETVNYGLAVILLVNVAMPFISTLLGLLTSHISRKMEYKADEQAVIEGYGEDIIAALKILSKENFADLNPHPLIVKLSYSHPTLLQRVRHIREYEIALKKED